MDLERVKPHGTCQMTAASVTQQAAGVLDAALHCPADWQYMAHHTHVVTHVLTVAAANMAAAAAQTDAA